MERVYIITGVYGHLGSTIARKLCERGVRVRGLVFAGERPTDPEGIDIEEVPGDIRDKASLRPLFEGLENYEKVVIHAAAVVDIHSTVLPITREVNVDGTKNIAELAREYGVWRFLHISSVHALPESPESRVISETKDYSADAVVGGYAKTKAEASRYIMGQIDLGLPAIILHPSGIIGPHDNGRNNAVRSIINFVNKRLPGSPRGGYDFVDVRDVADACIAAVDKGRVGEPYIICNRNYEMGEVFNMSSRITGLRARGSWVPTWLAKAVSPFTEWVANHKKKAPLVTSYSLHALAANDRFSHEKASVELGYWPRDMVDTLRDTLLWLSENGLIKRFDTVKETRKKRVAKRKAKQNI